MSSKEEELRRQIMQEQHDRDKAQEGNFALEKKRFDANPLFSGLSQNLETAPAPESVFFNNQSTPKKNEEEQLSPSDVAKRTLTEAIAKFRTDLQKPDANAATLVKPLLESFSSIKVGENQTLEIDNANDIFGVPPLKPAETERLAKLGLPEITKDLEFMQSALGFNSSYVQGGKQDIEYITKFSDKYAAQMPAFEAQHQAQLAEQARIAQEVEAARVIANKKSDEDYAKLADAAIAAQNAAPTIPVVAAKEEQAAPAPQPEATKQPAPAVVVASLRPTIADYSGNKYYPPEHGHTQEGMNLVGKAYYSGEVPPINGRNKDGKMPEIVDYDYADMITAVKAAQETNNLGAEKEALEKYIGKLDKYREESALGTFEASPGKIITSYVAGTYSKELSKYAAEKPEQNLSDVNRKIDEAAKAAIAPTPVEPPVAPEVVTSAPTNSALETLAKLKERAAEAAPAPAPSSTIQDTLAKLKQRASEAEPLPEPSIAIQNTLAQLKERAAQAETSKEPEKAPANPEQLAAMVDGAKALATYAVDKATDKVKHQYERAKELASNAGELLGAAAAQQQLKAQELAANNAKEQARVEALFTEAGKATTPPVAAVPAPANQPSLATTDFTAPIPTQGLMPLAEAPAPAKVEPEVAASPAKVLTPEEQAIADLDNGIMPPRAIVVNEDELDSGVLPPKNDPKLAKKAEATPKEAIASGATAHDYAIDIKKLVDGKDWNDIPTAKDLMAKGVQIDFPKGKPLIVTSKAGAELTQALLSLEKTGFSAEEFNLIASKIMADQGVVVDRAGKIDDIKPETPLNPTQIKDLASLAKTQSVAKN